MTIEDRELPKCVDCHMVLPEDPDEHQCTGENIRLQKAILDALEHDNG